MPKPRVKVTRVNLPPGVLVKRRNKYGNRKVTLRGHVFDSQREATRYQELKLLQRGGAISRLELQPVYHLLVNDRHVGDYRADFRYIDRRSMQVVVEDVKGYRTPVYRLKKKLVEAIYDVTIQEV